MIAYYGELCTKMYESDKSLAEGKELNFYLSFVKDNMRVLEPMCGNGRMLIPFLKRGIDIEGFDISEEMLRVCKEKGRKLNLSPVVFTEKIEEFSRDEKYDLIIIPFGSFSLLPNHLVHESLENMRTILKEDGKFLLTVMINNSETVENQEWAETNRKKFDQETIIEYKTVRYNEESLLNIKLKYQSIQGDLVTKTELMDFPIRLYEVEEFQDLLRVNGFNRIVVHDVKNGYGHGSSFQVFECGI
ncbi:methyltransferase domain-containing protein [Aquibacillus halophilus]|uniref:Methyltransferase domain-containing protein n=1 Tax=Aquibacillus halophilus TaxID=930132 RepID=A0A6A8DMR6_9BACI|nr:class I SAM-dependent methyltransferase [Aquibacillus halophilus]MRH45069.1 methyltransferase domain-containing protein [Aquibacillus halophilus]